MLKSNDGKRKAKQLALKILAFEILCAVVSSSCRLYQPSTTEKAREAVNPEEKATSLYETSEDVCPDFVGKQVCCNKDARNLLSVNFVKLLAATTCQTCLNNLQRLLFSN